MPLQKEEEQYNAHLFTDYSDEPLPSHVWVHVSCYKYFFQFHPSPVHSGLSLEALQVDEKKFYIQCQICKSKSIPLI